MDDSAERDSRPDTTLEALEQALAGEVKPERAQLPGVPTKLVAQAQGVLAGRPLPFADVTRLRQRLWESVVPSPEGGHGIGMESGGHTPQPAFAKPLRHGCPAPQARLAPSSHWIRYTIAGVIVGVLGVFLGWNGRSHHAGHSATRTVFTYATTNGERANITLPDGNLVTLNVGSRLDVPADYATGNHQVHLHGEALFTVIHHRESPFSVVVGTTATRVLGTKFLVRQYATDTTVTVAVQEGRVAVGTTVISASQMAEVGRGGVAHVGAADASLFSFPTGVLALNGIPLSSAIPELNRWYNADLRLGDTTLATLPIRGEFTAGAISELANDLTEAFGMRIVRAGRVLTLYSGTR